MNLTREAVREAMEVLDYTWPSPDAWVSERSRYQGAIDTMLELARRFAEAQTTEVIAAHDPDGDRQRWNHIRTNIATGAVVAIINLAEESR